MENITNIENSLKRIAINEKLLKSFIYASLRDADERWSIRNSHGVAYIGRLKKCLEIYARNECTRFPYTIVLHYELAYDMLAGNIEGWELMSLR